MLRKSAAAAAVGIPRAVKVLDGGFGSELLLSGFPDLNDDPLWSARILKENPNAIKDLHKRFLVAGSNTVITCTYQASVDGFMEFCKVSREEAKQLIALGVDLAKKAVEEFNKEQNDGICRYVAASVGPYGACMHDRSEYTGEYVDTMSIEELKDWHRERLQIMLSRKPDFLAIETLPAVKEAVALVELLREFPDAKAWVSFTCKDKAHTRHNDTVREAAEAVAKSSQIVSFGVNCCRPDYVIEVLKSVKDILVENNTTFVAYPNGGDEYTTEQRSQEKSWAAYATSWMDLGPVEWVGGCCLVRPKDITEISKAVGEWNEKNCVSCM